MRRKVIILTCLFSGAIWYSNTVLAQQQELYTMFMYNKLGLNPAYAGYHDHACFTAIYRNQWMGFDGAPESSMLSFQAPLNGQRIGIGANLKHAAIGVSSQTTFDGIYSYRIRMGSGTLSLGAQASVRYMQVDYADPRLRALQDIGLDPGVSGSNESKTVINFGAGAYYNTGKFYAGLSMPRLINSDIDFDDNNLFIAREDRHAYLMTGYVFDVDYNLDIVPQVLFRYTVGAPMSIDFNANFIWKQDYSAGITYRTGGGADAFAESIGLIVSARIARGLKLALSYDITFGEIREFSSGSLEVLLRYCFGQPQQPTEFTNPRYF